MASQSLYRKWRSQTFAELIGQEHVVQTLRNAIIEERVAHAYLFTGPRGVGKTSMARLLAKAVNCTDPNPEARPCGQCPACTSIAEGRAVDVIEMDAASHTSVEDAREIIERVQFRPAEMRSKVYIIDETHMLSTAAFNALLKTLEEPPDHAIFILATTEVHKVPATILSRCQRFTFTRHGIAATSSHLRQIATAEGLELEAGVPEAIARAATGSMRDALGVLEQLASFGQGAITLEQVHSLLGMTAAAEVQALIEALLDADVGAALRAVNGVADQGADVRQFTRDVVERLRALLLFRATNDRSLLDVGEDELRTLEVWAQRADPGDLVEWIKLLSGLDYQLRTTPYGHLPLELAVVEALVAPKRPEVSVAPRSMPKRPAPAQATTSDPPPADSAPASPRGPNTSPEEFQAANADMSILERMEAEWDEIIRHVRPLSPTVQALLRSIRPIDVEGNTIVLLASSTFHKNNLERASNTKLVEQVISKQLGGNFAIRCTIEEKPEVRDIRDQIRHARKDEHIRAALNIFDAHIVNIEDEDA